MQISKLLPAICAAAICAGLISVRAQDNPAQAAARAALMEKMNALDGTNVPPTASPATTSNDNPAQAAARAALLEKMDELDATNAPPSAIIVTPSGATLEKPASPAIQTPPEAPTLPETQTSAADSAAQARMEAQKEAALAAEKQRAAEAAQAQTKIEAQKEAALAENKRAAEAAAQAEAKAKAQQAAKAQKAAAKNGDLGLTPIEAPPLPISAAKQEQLQALLEKYKADQISPAEYQTRRAAILAQP